MDIGKGLLRSRVPAGNAILSQMRVKQPSPEQGVEMPHFGRFRSAWGYPAATSRQPPSLPPAGRAEVAPKMGADGVAFADLPVLDPNGVSSGGEGGRGGRRDLPGASQRAHGGELVLSLTQPEHGLTAGRKA